MLAGLRRIAFRCGRIYVCQLGLMLATICIVLLWSQFPSLDLPNWMDGHNWHFNPFAWQFLFTIRAVLTMVMPKHRGDLPAWRTGRWLAAAYLIVCLPANLSMARLEPAGPQPVRNGRTGQVNARSAADPGHPSADVSAFQLIQHSSTGPQRVASSDRRVWAPFAGGVFSRLSAVPVRPSGVPDVRPCTAAAGADQRVGVRHNGVRRVTRIATRIAPGPLRCQTTVDRCWGHQAICSKLHVKPIGG